MGPTKRGSLENDHPQKRAKNAKMDGWLGGYVFSFPGGLVINHNFKSMGCLTEPNDVSSCFTNDFLWPSLETDSQQMLCSSCLSSCGSVGTQKLW